MKGLYQHVREAWKKPKQGLGKELIKTRLIEWRKQPVIHRISRPTRIDRARTLGYKAKQGYIIVRARIRKGVTKKPSSIRGRRPKRYGRVRLPAAKSKQRITEERVSRAYPGLEVLNSYPVGEDGKQKWFEIILVDPNHPRIKKSKDIAWISSGKHKDRAGRGLTSAGKKSRGLRK